MIKNQRGGIKMKAIDNKELILALEELEKEKGIKKEYVWQHKNIQTKKIKKGVVQMLNEEICKVRDKLNKSIEKNVDYAIIYKISVELDILIAKYYNEEFIEAKKA